MMTDSEFSEAFGNVRQMLGLGEWEPLAARPEDL